MKQLAFLMILLLGTLQAQIYSVQVTPTCKDGPEVRIDVHHAVGQTLAFYYPGQDTIVPIQRTTFTSVTLPQPDVNGTISGNIIYNGASQYAWFFTHPPSHCNLPLLDLDVTLNLEDKILLFATIGERDIDCYVVETAECEIYITPEGDFISEYQTALPLVEGSQTIKLYELTIEGEKNLLWQEEIYIKPKHVEGIWHYTGGWRIREVDKVMKGMNFILDENGWTKQYQL